MESWEERLEQWGDGDIVVTIGYSVHDLSREELRWAEEYCKLVRAAAKKMMRNMLKGTLKYGALTGAFQRTPEEWVEYALDDATDTLNYMYLLKASMDTPKEDKEFLGVRA